MMLRYASHQVLSSQLLNLRGETLQLFQELRTKIQELATEGGF